MEQQNSKTPEYPGYEKPQQALQPQSEILQFVETPEQKAKRAEMFSLMGVPTLVYALLYTLLLYNNFHSITMPVFVVATLGYCGYLIVNFRKIGFKDLKVKPISLFCILGMLGLAVSTSMTGNWAVLMLNNAGSFVLLVCTLLFEFCDTGKWTLAKGCASVVQAIIGAVGCLSEPFSDFACFRKLRTKHKMKKTGYILIGVVAAIPLLGIVTALLYQADAVFANLLRGLFSFDFPVSRVFGIMFTFGYALFASYCGIRFLGKEKITAESKDLRRFEPMIANTILVLVSVVYLLFSFIQIFSLFLGKLQLPAGYTYAAYAREGFFQLLFVCVINVVLVLFFMGCFRENCMKKVLLTVISACTYIMIASSAFRMCLYIKNYHLTFLRVFVLWMLVLIAVLLAGIVAQIYKETFPLFRYTIVVVTLAVFGFGIVRPDYWIARYDIDCVTTAGDQEYLSYLSSDAAPVIAGHKGQWADRYWEHISFAMEGKDSVREYNFSYARAKSLSGK